MGYAPQSLYSGIQLCGVPDPANASRLDHGIVPMITRMMHNGMLVDVEAFGALNDRVILEQLEHAGNFYSDVGRSGFDIGSNDQIAALLFNSPSRGGLDLDPGPIRLTPSKTRYTVDDDALAYLESQHPAIKHLRKWRACDKIRTTYVESLPQLKDRFSRIHTSLNYTRTVTGRLSSSSPNLQNIPVRSALGRAVRKCFVPSPGRVLGAIDLSQIEIVLAGHYSRSKALLYALNNGVDIHTKGAAKFFDWDPARHFIKKDLLTPEENDQRSNAKIGNFGCIYEITGVGLSTRMIGMGADPDTWTPEYCDRYIESFYADDMYHEIRDDYQAVQHDRADYYGLVWTLFGRIRNIPEVYSQIPKIRAEGYRFASNTPIQGTAGDILKLIMMELHPIARAMAARYPTTPYALEPVLQVHDEILFEGLPDLMTEFMTYAAELVIPNCCRLLAPLKAGWGMTDLSWGDLKR